MKHKSRIFVILIISVLILIAGLTACAQNEPPSNGTEAHPLTLGAQSRPAQPETVEAFIPIFAEQLRRFNEIAPMLWPNNAVVNMVVILDDFENDQLWLIAPDGTVEPLSPSEAEGMGVTRWGMPGIWDFWGDFHVAGGGYHTITDNCLRITDHEHNWSRWAHVNTFDALGVLVHEAFHFFVQPDWAAFDDPAFGGPDQRLEDISARMTRYILRRQLIEAVANPGETQLVLDALATFEIYKTQHPEDYRQSIYADRKEGTAQYFEYAAGLLSYFPGQIDRIEDLDNAFTQLAIAALSGMFPIYTNDVGNMAEAYDIGAFSGILLNRLGVDWKEMITADGMLTPIEILARHFEGETLPAPRQPTQEEFDTVVADAIDRLTFIINDLTGWVAEMEESLAAATNESEISELEAMIATVSGMIADREDGLEQVKNYIFAGNE